MFAGIRGFITVFIASMGLLAASSVQATLLTYSFTGDSISGGGFPLHSGVAAGETFTGTLIYDTDAPGTGTTVDTTYTDPLGFLSVTLSGGLTVSSVGDLQLRAKDFSTLNRSDFLPNTTTATSTGDAVSQFLLFLVKSPGGGNLFPDSGGLNLLPNPLTLADFNTRNLIVDAQPGGVISRISGVIRTLTLVSSVEVPEPATLALFGLGLAGLGLTRRRRTA